MLAVYRFVAFFFILAGSAYFGHIGRTAEMGLAIVAGSIALAFSYIDKIQRFKGGGFEAEMRHQLEPIVAKETEPSLPREHAFIQSKTDMDTEKVVKALGSERYAWRYFGGIAKDTQLPKDKVQKALDWLVENQLASEFQGRQGRLWGLSAEGRTLLADIAAGGKARGS